MSELNAKLLFDDWDANAATSTMKANGYEYALDALERLGWFTASTQVAVTANDATFTLPAGAARLLNAFWDTRELFKATRESLHAEGEAWQDALGIPLAYTEDKELDGTFRLYPRPPLPSDAFTYPNAEPFGRDYPRYAVVTVTSQRTDPPTWLDPVAALMMLAYARDLESSTQDLTAVDAAVGLAAFLIEVVNRA